MVKIIITVDSNIDIPAQTEQFQDNLLDELSLNTKRILERNTPVDTGKATNAWEINRSENQHEIVNTTRYLPWVNDGTGLYGPNHARIVPRRARFLHFYWLGREWFLKSVRGQKGQKFVEKSMKEVANEMESVVVRAANKSFK